MRASGLGPVGGSTFEIMTLNSQKNLNPLGGTFEIVAQLGISGSKWFRGKPGTLNPKQTYTLNPKTLNSL